MKDVSAASVAAYDMQNWIVCDIELDESRLYRREKGYWFSASVLVLSPYWPFGVELVRSCS